VTFSIGRKLYKETLSGASLFVVGGYRDPQANKLLREPNKDNAASLAHELGRALDLTPAPFSTGGGYGNQGALSKSVPVPLRVLNDALFRAAESVVGNLGKVVPYDGTRLGVNEVKSGSPVKGHIHV